MGAPSDNREKRMVAMFDSFCKTVASETLYKALLSLPENQRKVLLLDFWYDLTDEEIAKRMEVTVRTVYNYRQRAFQAIRIFYERGCSET